jgi:hypothetical protein
MALEHVAVRCQAFYPVSAQASWWDMLDHSARQGRAGDSRGPHETWSRRNPCIETSARERVSDHCPLLLYASAPLHA